MQRTLDQYTKQQFLCQIVCNLISSAAMISSGTSVTVTDSIVRTHEKAVDEKAEVGGSHSPGGTYARETSN